MPNKLTKVSVNLRSAKLRLQKAEQLIATAGDLDTKNDIDKAISHVESAIKRIDRQSAAIPA
jgi:hypothetical protein